MHWNLHFIMPFKNKDIFNGDIPMNSVTVYTDIKSMGVKQLHLNEQLLIKCQ